MQCQWRKAGVLDMSIKDFIISSAEGVRMRAVPINLFGEATKVPLWGAKAERLWLAGP
jgi:hypothetical protein